MIGVALRQSWFRALSRVQSIRITTPLSIFNHVRNSTSFSQVHYDPCPETIFAVSSGHGKSALAVVRVSGSVAAHVLKIMMNADLPKPRYATLTTLHDPKSLDILDKAIVLWFPGQHSFTGEDSCEFHVHGGIAVVNSVLTALAKIKGCRAAEAGEFTKRAFLNGKMDLTEVEGLADLIHAETEAQRKQALRQVNGELSQVYQSWRDILVKCSANVEAYIDFSEDQNIEEDIINQVLANVEILIDRIIRHLEDNRRGERLRTGVKLAILGEPNVGKSSLLNRLCRRDAAIVSDLAGTTRDVIETSLDFGGYPVTLCDTAGLRTTKDVVEKEGVKRALQQARGADIKLLVLDAQKFDEIKPDLKTYLDEYLKRLTLSYSENDVIVFNKSDLIDRPVTDLNLPCNFISCLTEAGFHDFLDVIHNHVQSLCANPSDANPSLTQARHRVLLEQCLEYLEKFLKLRKLDVVLAAEELRQAQRCLGKVTGKITTEDILDVIFRDFCIGK